MATSLLLSAMPSTVYHYCNVETFFKIIQNHTLRLSDIEKSNDFMEKKWAIQQSLTHIERNLNNPAYPCSKKPELAEQLLGAMEQHFRTYNMMILACCFSSERDLLSQWRGYGDNGCGVSIGIDSASQFRYAYERTQDYFRAPQTSHELPSNLCFHSIQYGAEQIQDIVMNLFSTFLSWLPLRISIDQAAHSLVRILYPALPFFKSLAFSEEAEWRCVFFPRLPAPPYRNDTFDEEQFQPLLEQQKQPIALDSFQLQPLQYRLRQSNLIPYRDLAFRTDQPFLRSVTIGPKCPLDRETVKLLLELHGIPISMDRIYLSDVSYR
ncbi:MAG: DUF2971 domain-containing protein [Eubacteriales bacterium]|nr:DUF2971 domain-containing protein [Eubacteriales bacterium]